MYNMSIAIFGYKVSIEVLILIGIIYLILFVHTMYGTCNPSGLIIENMRNRNMHNQNMHNQKHQKEGFVGANTNYGESSSYNLLNDKPKNTSSWFQPDLRVTAGKPLSQGVKNILNRPSQPVPLPPGELDMFATTPFKPECCPNTYSTSTGCACMTTSQYNYLSTRGGNNAPYSEY
jgi:hypothetical protein